MFLTSRGIGTITLSRYLIKTDKDNKRNIMTKIKVRHGESLDQALRRFNKEVLKSGIIQEMKDREHYSKPSEIKRQKNKELKRKFYLERNKY